MGLWTENAVSRGRQLPAIRALWNQDAGSEWTAKSLPDFDRLRLDYDRTLSQSALILQEFLLFPNIFLPFLADSYYLTFQFPESTGNSHKAVLNNLLLFSGVSQTKQCTGTHILPLTTTSYLVTSYLVTRHTSFYFTMVLVLVALLLAPATLAYIGPTQSYECQGCGEWQRVGPCRRDMPDGYYYWCVLFSSLRKLFYMFIT